MIDLTAWSVKETNSEAWSTESLSILLDVLHKLAKIKFKPHTPHHLFEWTGMRHHLGPKAGIFKRHRSYSGVVHWLKLLNPPLLSHIYLWLLSPVLPRFHVSSRTLPFSFHSLCLTFLPTPSNKLQIITNYPPVVFI